MKDRLLAGAVCFFKGLLELLPVSGQPGMTFSWILPYAKYLHFSTKKATIDREKKPLKKEFATAAVQAYLVFDTFETVTHWCER